MSWVKLDDQFFRHPKVLEAGRDARDLYLAGLCFSASSLTDGFIQTRALRLVSVEAEVDQPDRAAARLVEVGLWEAVNGGWLVHDYLEYNPSGEAVRAERAAAKARMQRIRSGNVRPNKERTSAAVHPLPSPSPINKESTDVEERILAPQEPQAADAADIEPPEPGNIRTIKTPKTPRTVNGFNYGEMWELIEADVGERITWNRDKEGKAVKNLLSRHQDAMPADFAAFLRYKRQTFRGDPNGEVTFTRYYEDFGAWWRAGKPDKVERTTTNGRTHEPDNLTRKLRDIAAGAIAGEGIDLDGFADGNVLDLRPRAATERGGASRNGQSMGPGARPGA